MAKERKVYLPKWIAWMVTVILAPAWAWLTYSTLAGQKTEERLSVGEWVVASIVFLGSIVMVFLMSYGKLPAYMIKEEDQ